MQSNARTNTQREAKAEHIWNNNEWGRKRGGGKTAKRRVKNGGAKISLCKLDSGNQNPTQQIGFMTWPVFGCVVMFSSDPTQKGLCDACTREPDGQLLCVGMKLLPKRRRIKCLQAPEKILLLSLSKRRPGPNFEKCLGFVQFISLSPAALGLCVMARWE